MNNQGFFLQPFHPVSIDLEIKGAISRNLNRLAINYQLYGDLANIEIPPPANIPTRKNELWETTCFEMFLGSENSPDYWEFNLSPAGHWNIYHFDDYRQGMEPLYVFESLPFAVKYQGDRLQLFLEFDLDKILPQQQIKVSITTVIKFKTGEITYWALKHCGEQPDFHLRDSFALEC